MFNGDLVNRLLKEQKKTVGEMVAFVFGQSSHISSSYFKGRTYIDSRYLIFKNTRYYLSIIEYFPI